MMMAKISFYCILKFSFSKVAQNWIVKKISSKENKKHIDHLMGDTIKMKSENMNYKLTPLPLIIPKCLTSKAKPDNNECIKNQCAQCILAEIKKLKITF